MGLQGIAGRDGVRALTVLTLQGQLARPQNVVPLRGLSWKAQREPSPKPAQLRLEAGLSTFLV